MIVALVATTAFYRQAQAVNAHPGKAASVPFMAAGLFLIVGYCISYALRTFAAWADVAPATVRMITIMADVFFTLAYLQLIRRNWLALTAPASHSDARRNVR